MTRSNQTEPASKSDERDQTVEGDPHSFYHFFLDEIGPSPRSGSGVHRYVFRAALWLKDVCSKELADDVISRAVGDCGREVPEREIKQAIELAHLSEVSEQAPKWPRKDQVRINQIALQGPTLSGLQRLSPFNTSTIVSKQIIDLLFPGDATRVLLCVGKALDRAETRPKVALYGVLAGMQFIVPNPMKSIKGTTKLNTRYFRTLDNTGPRRFLVVECDPMRWEDLPQESKALFGTEENYKRVKRDECAAVLWHLAKIAPQFPLVMVVDIPALHHSGISIIKQVARFHTFHVSVAETDVPLAVMSLVHPRTAVSFTGRKPLMHLSI
jgi:hypothetical protein